jgi:uncharacterized membrane protein YgcG
MPRRAPKAPATIRLLAALAFGVGIALAAARPIAAQDVPRLDGQVTDQVGVVGGGRPALDQALKDLLDRAAVQLWIAFVKTTGTETAPAFAEATFAGNGLGGNDFLLVVAVDDRRYGWWEVNAVPSLATDEIDALLSLTLEPRFRAGDYPGGVADFATALEARLVGGPSPAPTAEPTVAPTPTPAGTSGGGVTPPPAGGDGGRTLVLAILVVVGLVIVAAIARRWWLDRRSGEERDRRTGTLAREANAKLIAADDDVRESAQELDFAEAQFDEADVAPLRDALASARTELTAAFSLRQRLDDAEPETPEERAAMLGEIVERSDRISGSLDEARRRIQQLREEEVRAPEILDALPGRIAALEARIPAAAAATERLAAYAPATTAAVIGTVEEARKRLADSTAEVARGKAKLAGPPPDPHAAGRSVRRVTGALAESTALLDGVERLVATLDEARGRVDEEIRAAAADLETARAAAASSPGDPGVTDKLAQATALLEAARRAGAAAQPDVLAAVRDAQQANATADGILAGIREAEAQRRREAAALDAAIRSAEAAVARASDYITTRRSGVGREARTRLAEAERHLADARELAATDGPRATGEATTAARLADEAYRLARSDFDGWDQRGGRGQNDLGILIGGMILGGILRGGRRGGGWGGTPWGMPGGGRGWGGGGFGGGGFGGGRGGGGGFGGGRGGGGGW